MKANYKRKITLVHAVFQQAMFVIFMKAKTTADPVCHQERLFTCGDGTCVDISGRCDRTKYDCPDGTDEFDCDPTPTPSPGRCGSVEFRCDDGKCIDRRTVCDSLFDCRDGSDEKGCGCMTNQFRCSNGQCIDMADRCDGRNDCRDRSDEKDCLIFATSEKTISTSTIATSTIATSTIAVSCTMACLVILVIILIFILLKRNKSHINANSNPAKLSDVSQGDDEATYEEIGTIDDRTYEAFLQSGVEDFDKHTYAGMVTEIEVPTYLELQ